MRALLYLGCFLYVASFASAAVLSASSLSGKYFVRHVEFTTDSSNNVTDARSIIGTINFDGSGTYSFAGQQVVGTGVASSYTASGTYTVNPGGFVTMTNPQKNTYSINARFGVEAVIGSSTEAAGNTFDLFVAIPAPTATQTNGSAASGWAAADFELTGASTAQVRNSLVSASLDGSGNIASLTLNGHAANFNKGNVVNQAVTGGSYSVTGDGSGSIAFPVPAGVTGAGAMLSAAARTLYISNSGNIILAGTAGAHDIFVAVRNATSAVNLTTGQRFWNTGLRVDSSGSADSYAGSSTVIVTDNSFIATRRLHETGNAAFNMTAASIYTLAADGTGSAGPAGIAIGQGGSLVGANIGNPLDPTGYEIGVGVAIPSVSGTGVFVNPQAIVNAASNAPAGDAIAPGEFIAIYGSGLAAATAVANALPFPTSLGGVTVSINGALAPVYFVSSGQIDCIVPYGVTGQSAAITVTSNNAASNSVSVSLAKTAPGVFTVDTSGTGDGAIEHGDGTLVNAASPAKKGEMVVMFVSGLGGLTTPVTDGSGASGANNATTQLTVYVAGIPSTSVTYQGLTVEAGLYQINFQVPANLTFTGELPVAIQTPEAFTDSVNMAVQ
jgi:uncharacterized protein (TIGR03437 family)